MIELTRLSKTYDSTSSTPLNVLRSVDLTISEGDFTAIMGPSGSGKSTLLNVIGMLDTFQQGTYKFKGTDIISRSSDDLADLRLHNLGFVFQGFNLVPQLTARLNVELPLIYTGLKKSERQAKSIEKLAALGLGDRLDHKPNELSGGQQQRVAIARALINDPSLVIADEPTGSLDTETGIEIMSLFQRLNQEGKTIVMVTHEEDIASFATRIIRMRDGRILN